MIRLRDLDYLAARLGGRRSRLAEGDRLERLCELRTPDELAESLYPGAGLTVAAEIERHLEEDLAHETCELADCTSGARARLLRWLALRAPLTNLKVAVRALAAQAPADVARPLLIRLPPGFEPFGPALLDAPGPKELVASLPPGPLALGLARAFADAPDPRRSFFQELALDRAFLAELLSRSKALTGEECELASALARQEIASHDLLLAARGRFFHGLEKADLMGLYVGGSAVDLHRFAAMLDAPDVGSLRALAANAAVEPGPPEPDLSKLEALTRERRARLANRAARGGHAGFAAVLGYLALRRVEIGNLTTLSEGLRLRLPSGPLLSRMVPRVFREAAHA